MTATTFDCMPRPAGSRRATPLRTSQIEDEVWIPALRVSFLRKEKMSQVIRAAVVRYLARHRALLDADPEWPECAAIYRETGKWRRDEK